MADSQNDSFTFGFTVSLIGHAVLFALMIFGGPKWGMFEQPVVYSVTLEGGKTLGGKTEVSKTDRTVPLAPHMVKSQPVRPPEEKKAALKPEEKAEVSLAEKKEEPKPTPKAAATVAPKPTSPPQPTKAPQPRKKTAQEELAELNKKLNSGIDRLIKESHDAGGQGHGAAAVTGGRGMGGGVQKPPEFFIYRDRLEQFIKSGWHWFDSRSPLLAQVVFDIAPDGRVSNIRIASSSGNPQFDASVLRAVAKANPVPPPPSIVYEDFKTVRFTFDPRK